MAKDTFTYLSMHKTARTGEIVTYVWGQVKFAMNAGQLRWSLELMEKLMVVVFTIINFRLSSYRGTKARQVRP